MLTKEKMARLQQLYIDQINRLQHLYREKRRKYLQSIKKEKETMRKSKWTCITIADFIFLLLHFSKYSSTDQKFASRTTPL